MYARVPQAMAQFVLKIKFVPYHGANPNTRNGAHLRSPSLIMAPDMSHYTMIYKNGERTRDFLGLFVFIVV